MSKKLFKSREEWRAWLEQYHDKEKEIWLVYYKKSTGKASVKYEEAVEEALCFGWIDSLVKRINEEKYMQKYTPRKTNSIWSEKNKQRINKVFKEKRMTQHGLEKIRIAKKNGSWDKIDKIVMPEPVPSKDLLKTLEKDKTAKDKFDKIPPSHKKQYLWWIESAKRPETRIHRIQETIKRVKAGRAPGM